MTVLRATAWPAHADEPYGPIIRAIGPTLLGLPDETLPGLLGPATSEVVRLLPEVGPRLTAIGARIDDGGQTAPERRQARTLEGILGLLGRLGERHPVVLVLEDLHLADAATRALITFLARISRDQRLAIIGTHQPDVVARDDSWTSDLAAILTGSRPDRLALPPLDRDELAAAHRGDRGRARLGQPAAARRRAVGRAAARGRGAAGRTARAAERVADRFVRGARDRTDGRPLAGMPARAAPAGPGRAPAHLGSAGGRGRRVRGGHEPLRAAVGHRPAGRRRRARPGPVGGPDRGARQRLPGRAGRGRRVPPRLDRQGRRLGPAADRPDAVPRRARDEPGRAAVGHRRALAGGIRSDLGASGGHRGSGGGGDSARRRG